MKKLIETINNNKKYRIIFRICFILLVILFEILLVLPFFKNFPIIELKMGLLGRIIHTILRIAVLALIILYIIKGKSKILKIILIIIALYTYTFLFLRTYVDFARPEEVSIEKRIISETSYIESVSYPKNKKIVKIFYRRQLLGSLYCHKELFTFESEKDDLDKDIEEIIPIEKYYDKIKDIDLGFCASKFEEQNYKYQDGELIKK